MRARTIVLLVGVGVVLVAVCGALGCGSDTSPTGITAVLQRNIEALNARDITAYMADPPRQSQLLQH